MVKSFQPLEDENQRDEILTRLMTTPTSSPSFILPNSTILSTPPFSFLLDFPHRYHPEAFVYQQSGEIKLVVSRPISLVYIL